MDNLSMDQFFPTLFSKTFFILSFQLSLTWLTTAVMSWLLSHDTAAGPDGTETAGDDEQKTIDEQKEKAAARWFTRPVFRGLLIADSAVFLVLLFWGMHHSFAVALALFSAWSILTGVLLEAVLVEVGDGVGKNALALTATVVLGAALIGIYSNVDFGFLRPVLFIALLILIVLNILRISGRFERGKQKALALAGVIIFSLYLVADFNFLLFRKSMGRNDWGTAFDAAVGLYLDIVNLFLDLMDFLSK